MENNLKCCSSDNYDEFLSELIGEKQSFYIYCTGSDRSDGVSWCPDCEVAKPVVEELWTKIPSSKTVLKFVIDREEWRGNKDHPLRVDKRIKVKSIPTLIAYQKGKEVNRLVEEQLSNLENAIEFVEQF